MKKYELLFLFLIISFISLSAQERPEFKLRSYSFGSYWQCSSNFDWSLLAGKDIDQRTSRKGVLFRDSVFYTDIELLEMDALSSIIKAKEIKTTWVNSSSIKGLYVENAAIDNEININSLYCENVFVIKEKSSLIRDFRVNIDTCRGYTEFANDVSFRGKFSFGFGMLLNRLLISDVTFAGRASFSGSNISQNSVVNDDFKIQNTTFLKHTYFNFISFKKNVTFTKSSFIRSVSFAYSEFFIQPVLSSIVFNDTLDFTGCKFNAGVDLGRCNLNNVNSIFLEETVYPAGKLFIDWAQIGGGENPKIKLLPHKYVERDSNNIKYKKLEIIYFNLRNNYLLQDRKRDANSVMFELACYKDSLIGNMWFKLYGLFLGYGYKPWRFLIFLVIPVIFIFSAVWYYFYYGCMIYTIEEGKRQELLNMERNGLNYPVTKTKLIPITIYDHKNIPPQRSFIKVLYAFYFSGSVLLSIRFKKEWICELPEGALHRKYFIFWVTAEWVFGLLLYIIFGLFVLSSEFGFVKGLFGI